MAYIAICRWDMENIVIGIEGLVGSGKTSICKKMLEYVPNSIILHGGNLYRGIIYALMNLNKEIDLKNLKSNISNIDIKDLMDKLKVEFRIENRESIIYVDGIKIDENILQNKENSIAVSIAGGNADNKHFYVFARDLIDKYKTMYNVIVSGRDLMKIYPDLDYHFFITASLEERVKRKMKQYGDNNNYEQIKQNIVKRDELQDEAGYYKIYDNTIKVDVTDCSTIEDSTLKVMKYLDLKN